MKFRYARHSDDIKPLIEFYTKVIGLDVLGDFDNHSGYNGVFLGVKGLDWHLEFTESIEKVEHSPDKDDLIVLYFDSIEEIDRIIARAERFGVNTLISKNPYWQSNGFEMMDPDSYGVVLTLSQSN